MIGSYLLLARTAFGLRIRASLENPALARASGISTNAIYGATFAFGAALAGLAGALIVPVFSLFADLGLRFLIQGFVAVMVGGVGSFAGPVAGAGVIGTLAAALPWIIPPVIADVLVFVLAIIFIKFRPQGLISTKGSSPCSATATISAVGDFSPTSPLPVPAIATGVGSWVVRPDWANAASDPIKVGIATDLTGPIGYAGNADANVAKMVIKEINDAGGLLGRPLELFIEDTASNESVAVGNVRKLIQRDKVDLVLGGITSSMRNAIKDVIVARGKTLYIYPAAVRGQGMHALSVLYRPDTGAAVRRIHSLADQERRQEVRAAERQLCLAAHAERLCTQGDRGQRRRSHL